MKIKYMFLPAFLLASVVLSSCDKNDDNKGNDLNATDKNFLVNASISNNAEIELANLAVSKAVSPVVTSFAQQMITDHTTAQSDLKDVANKVNFAITDSIDALHQVLKDQLTTLEGSAFDSAYIHSQVADHDQALSLYNLEQTSGNQNGVLYYANNYKPKIQMHRDLADSIATNMFP